MFLWKFHFFAPILTDFVKICISQPSTTSLLLFLANRCHNQQTHSGHNLFLIWWQWFDFEFQVVDILLSTKSTRFKLNLPLKFFGTGRKIIMICEATDTNTNWKRQLRSWCLYIVFKSISIVIRSRFSHRLSLSRLLPHYLCLAISLLICVMLECAKKLFQLSRDSCSFSFDCEKIHTINVVKLLNLLNEFLWTIDAQFMVSK